MPKIISENPLGQIGQTPLVHLSRLTDRNTATVWGKMEGSNPGGSVKDRIALAMIERAEKDGCIASATPSSSRPAATPASASPWSVPSRATS